MASKPQLNRKRLELNRKRLDYKRNDVLATIAKFNPNFKISSESRFLCILNLPISGVGHVTNDQLALLSQQLDAIKVYVFPARPHTVLEFSTEDNARTAQQSLNYQYNSVVDKVLFAELVPTEFCLQCKKVEIPGLEVTWDFISVEEEEEILKWAQSIPDEDWIRVNRRRVVGALVNVLRYTLANSSLMMVTVFCSIVHVLPFRLYWPK